MTWSRTLPWISTFSPRLSPLPSGNSKLTTAVLCRFLFDDILENVTASRAPTPVEPIPVAPSPAVQESPEPVAHAACSSPPPELPETPQIPVIPKYWQRHESEKAMAVFARKTSAFIRLDSPTFFRGVVYYSRSVVLSLIRD